MTGLNCTSSSPLPGEVNSKSRNWYMMIWTMTMIFSQSSKKPASKRHFFLEWMNVTICCHSKTSMKIGRANFRDSYRDSYRIRPGPPMEKWMEKWGPCHQHHPRWTAIFSVLFIRWLRGLLRLGPLEDRSQVEFFMGCLWKGLVKTSENYPYNVVPYNS